MPASRADGADDIPARPTTQEEFIRFARASVERELAAFEAAERAAELAVAALDGDGSAESPGRSRPAASTAATASTAAGWRSSVVFAVRLDPQELAALQRVAAARGLRPSVLARTLIREGLRPGPPDTAAAGSAVDRLETTLLCAVAEAVAGVREAITRPQLRWNAPY